MFGLEKKNKVLFEFDLEKDLQADPSKMQHLLKHVESKIQELKGVLREGTKAEDFDKCGALLHGYAALQKVLNRMTTQKKS